MIAGWGEKKVQQWCASVQEPFRVARAAKRGIDVESLNLLSQPVSRAGTLSRDVTRDVVEEDVEGVEEEEEEDIAYAGIGNEVFVPDNANVTSRSGRPPSEVPPKRKASSDALSDGVLAALSKLRKT